ncbi:MAG: hypothetical protein UGF83_04920 [Collinsella sp.]|nr:hypothetical protein [Collinsella sp.]
MDEMDMSLKNALEDCEQAAEALASQSDGDRDIDMLIREKRLESMETQLDAMEGENDIRRMNRAEAIENLEGLAMLLDRLPAHDFYGYKMTGYANYVSCTINAALEVLKKNN